MQKYPLEKVVLIILQSQRGEAFLLHKFALKSELGELFTSLKLFPFMERGSVSDLNTATNNGYYNLTGSVSNFPIENMWTTMLVIGGAYKIQVVFNVTNDISELYIRKYYLSDNTFTKWKIFT